MTTSTGSAVFAVDQGPTPVGADSDGFELDVRIVEAGPVAAALLGDTDNGCDTVQGSDC
jgi:FxLD family lantipeptide